MFVDTAGELIADVMTMNRGLSSIPSASSILDTSNYTFQAISYGKDALGFQYHAHKIISPSSDGWIKVISYGNSTFSGYITSATEAALKGAYKILPASPTPMDTRLESKSTLPNYSSGIVDVGHYLNPIILSSVSSFAHLTGGFPASGGTNFKVLNSSGGMIFSGSLSSIYNKYQLLDPSGFLKFSSNILSNNQSYNQELQADPTKYFTFSGVIRSAEADFPTSVELIWPLIGGDAGSLNLFGGVYHIGLWYLDIKEMLKEGNNPPYSFNPLNNTRKYKLFAKKTFNSDLLYYNGNNTFYNYFIDFVAADPFFNGSGLIFKWKIRLV